jgi:hypothetical protein
MADHVPKIDLLPADEVEYWQAIHHLTTMPDGIAYYEGRLFTREAPFNCDLIYSRAVTKLHSLRADRAFLIQKLCEIYHIVPPDLCPTDLNPETDPWCDASGKIYYPCWFYKWQQFILHGEDVFQPDLDEVKYR